MWQLLRVSKRKNINIIKKGRCHICLYFAIRSLSQVVVQPPLHSFGRRACHYLCMMQAAFPQPANLAPLTYVAFSSSKRRVFPFLFVFHLPFSFLSKTRPGWCNEAYIDEQQCDDSSPVETWSTTGPSCADTCCKLHDTCCGHGENDGLYFKRTHPLW